MTYTTTLTVEIHETYIQGGGIKIRCEDDVETSQKLAADWAFRQEMVLQTIAISLATLFQDMETAGVRPIEANVEGFSKLVGGLAKQMTLHIPPGSLLG